MAHSVSCDYGIIPIENSTFGAVIESYDALRDPSFGPHQSATIVGQHYLAINHQLLARFGVKMEDINTVYSHEQVSSQALDSTRRPL